MARAINATSDGAGWHMQERKWYVTCRGSKRVPCTSLAECCCMDEKRFWHALMKVWIPKGTWSATCTVSLTGSMHEGWLSADGYRKRGMPEMRFLFQ